MRVLAEFVEILILLVIFAGVVMALTAAYKWFNKNYLTKKNK